MIVLLVVTGMLNSLGLAYFSRFAGATQSLGRALGASGVGNGMQNSITPPWQANLALLNYAVTIGLVGITGYRFGFGVAVLACLAIFVAVLIWRALIPRETSAHFSRLIMTSMSARQTRFARNGDAARAAAMKDLLSRLEVCFGTGDGAGINGGAAASPMANDVAAAVISAYAKAMKNRKTPYGELSQLPHPKSWIKEAFIHGIRRSEGQMREHLMGAYVTLAEWQEGGEAYLDPSELAKDPGAAMKAALAPGFLEMPQKVATEAHQLQAELVTLGLD